MLNTEVTKELVEEKKPDAVILATGGKQLVPSIKGIDKENVFLAHDVLEGIKKVGRNVLIAGAGLVGLETADGYDSIIIAMGAKAYNPLEEELKGIVPEVHVIGDAKEAGQANKATEEAAAVAFRI